MKPEDPLKWPEISTLQKVSEEFDKMKIDIDFKIFPVAQSYYKYWIQLLFILPMFTVQKKASLSEATCHLKM